MPKIDYMLSSIAALRKGFRSGNEKKKTEDEIIFIERNQRDYIDQIYAEKPSNSRTYEDVSVNRYWITL